MKLERLAGRDGPECHICGLCCRFEKKGKPEHLRIAATRDHLIPKALGGHNSDGNLRLAHAYCNGKRGTGEVTEELKRKCRAWILRYVGIDEIEKAQRSYLGIKQEKREKRKGRGQKNG